MNTSELIKKLCEEHNLSIAELARMIEQSPQNFGKKLKRNTVSQSELNQIAKVLGVKYEQAFVSNKGVNDCEPLEDEILISKYITDELGLTIQPINLDDLPIDDNYLRLDKNIRDDIFARISPLLDKAPHYVTEIRAEQMASDTYKVIYDKGLGQLQQSAKNRDKFRANIVSFGTNNNVVGQAELEKFYLKVTSPALVICDIAAMITNQYYLAKIDSKLASLDDKLNYVQKFLEEDKKSDLWANGQFLRDTSSKLLEISYDEQYRITTLANVQNIRIDTLSNVKFYQKMMIDFVKTDFRGNLKDSTATNEILKRFYDYFNAYLYSVYVYGFAYVIEVALSQITDETFLSKVKNEIQNVIDSFQKDLLNEPQKYIDTVKSLNPSALTESFSGSIPRSHISGNSSLTTVLEVVGVVANIVANYDKGKKRAQKEEVEKQLISFQKQAKRGISDIEAPIRAMELLCKIYNEPVELLITDEAAYIKLTQEEN